MSDPVQNFELILKKHCNDKPSTLYSDKENQSKHTYNPQEVISSVSLQLKAIYLADSMKSNKRVTKDFKNVKKSTFLSVNNLPITAYEPPKHTAKFDTQCVTDTQLINVIEDAEIRDAHIGMTQEFETAFIHTNTEIQDKYNKNCDLDVDFKESITEVDNLKDIVEETEKLVNNEENIVYKQHLKIDIINDKANIKINTDEVVVTNETNKYKANKEIKKSNLEEELHSNTQAEFSQLSLSKIQKYYEDDFKNISKTQEELFSQILQTKTLKNKPEMKEAASTRESNIHDTQIEKCSELLNECIEIEDNENTERPPSPIFISKHVKIKSRTPSPLVFNLEKFEHFESIAISLLETHDLTTTKHLINSQLLNKELHLKIDDVIVFNDRDISNVDFEIKEDAIKSLGSPIIDKGIEVIEIDKEISDNILNQLNKQAGAKVETTTEMFKDEILFSSDEEDDYIHKDYQDLPFTCALETSFYNQSDVLDKNMYVGFQTASNRSIQVCADSFARAKCILSDVDDDITIAELVKNCESAVKNKSNGEQAERDQSEKSIEFNLIQEKSEISVSNVSNKSPVKVMSKEKSKVNDFKTQQDKNNFKGFMTANNKKINLSEKALARCKKVFQDIDLNEDFDCANNNVQEMDIDFKDNLKGDQSNINSSKEQNTKSKINPIYDVLESIDEDIIQEFENIEMSLKDDKEEETDLIISSKSMQILKNMSKDFDTKSKQNVSIKVVDTQETVLSQIIGNQKPKIANPNIGFKTASNKNITISSEAWVKTKNMFENLDAIKLPNKTEKVMNEVDINRAGNVKSVTSKHNFVAFKTANNKDINISDQAIEQTRNIFTDIDSSEEMSKISKHIPKENNSKINTLIISQPSTSTGFVGFKTANNKNIKISKESWTKSKNLFNNIDSTEYHKKGNKSYPKERPDIESMNEETHFKKPDDPFLGFKTTNNINTHISAEALAKYKSIFNDIDTPDRIKPTKPNKDLPNMKAPKTVQQIEIESKRVKSIEFPGFKSASNKVINVSKKALAQTRNFFKELDSNDLDIGNEMFKEDHVIGVADERVCGTEFVGFKFANHKNIKIARKALAKTKRVFNFFNETELKQGSKTKAHDPDIGKHYKTTENNLLLINKDEASKNSRQETNTPEFIGFKTASNKTVKVTTEALIKTKNIFKDIDTNNDFDIKDNIYEEKDLYPKELINNEPMSPVLKGFQTASKKPVAVSLKALDKNKKIFERLDEQDTKFTGFQTANNKQVNISDKASANCKITFKDIAINDDIKVLSNKDKVKSLYPEEILQEKIDEEDANILLNKGSMDTAPQFRGFQTASKKPVAISKSALEKSKKVFQDLDINNENKTLNYIVIEESLIKTKKAFDVDSSKSYRFLGFQTANDQKVIVSEDALAKSKKLFQDIEYVEIENIQKDIVNKPSNYKIGFQTGNNKSIAVSDEAIAKTKRLFSEIEEEITNINKKNKKAIENEEVHAIIDTQVLNNFEQSLCTEDFQKSPQNSKRAGSPILSCPRAKKRKKFETPYNIKNVPKPTHLLKDTEQKETTKITFNHDYKKNKKYTLKDLNSMAKNTTKNVDAYLLNFDYENLIQFEFNDNRNDLTDGYLTTNKLKELFLNSVNSKLVPKGWIDNHLKLILWKLISYEVKFKLFICTARNILDQLKYRYDKELYNAQRPALRKIFERDDVPSKTMVLCVVGIYVEGVKVSSIPNTASNVELLLTDGWYCIHCNIDRMLTELVCKGSITVGSKIVTSGAELTGCEQGVSPLEDTSAIRLKIFGNSTRRARWDARLGYHGNSAILCQLSSVKVLGGKVSKLRVYITRVYPALYVEKFEDGSTVTRSERLENLHQMKSEAERQAFMEKLYEEVEKEFVDQESQDSEGLSDSDKRTCMDSGSQIARMMKRSKDPAEYRAQLTDSQLNLLEAHTTKSRDKLLQNIQTRVRDRVEKAGVCASRNVVSLLKIRVAGVSEKGDGVCVTKGMMSIWKPNDAIQEIIKEGAWIDVLNVVPTAVRYSEIQISAGRQSMFSTSKTKEPEKFKPYTKLLQRQCYPLKDLAQTPYLSTDYNEIDTVGLIFSIEPSIKEFDSTKQSFQNIYLADAEKNIICVNFWGGLKKFGFQNVLDTGQVIACVNLQKRAGNTRKSIPHFRVTEFSYFTQTPKFDSARIMISDLNKKMIGLDRRKFCQDCIVLKNNYSLLKNNENISPYRFMNTDINISKNKMFVDSPLIRQNKIEDNLNLTGLDFESTFKQDSELSEEMLQRKKKVNEKIARLKMYGEPPPLSPLHIINRSKQACSSYKSPLLSNNNTNNSICENYKNQLRSKSDSSINVANINKTPEKYVESEISNSPVLLNRTYVKSVNPVRINFDKQDNNDSNVDNFGDDFEGSPPLSLD